MWTSGTKELTFNLSFQTNYCYKPKNKKQLLALASRIGSHNLLSRCWSIYLTFRGSCFSPPLLDLLENPLYCILITNNTQQQCGKTNQTILNVTLGLYVWRMDLDSLPHFKIVDIDMTLTVDVFFGLLNLFCFDIGENIWLSCLPIPWIRYSKLFSHISQLTVQLSVEFKMKKLDQNEKHLD